MDETTANTDIAFELLQHIVCGDSKDRCYRRDATTSCSVRERVETGCSEGTKIRLKPVKRPPTVNLPVLHVPNTPQAPRMEEFQDFSTKSRKLTNLIS